MFKRQKGKIKSLCPAFLRKSNSLPLEKEGKPHSIHRLVLLLILAFYSAASVFRLANSPIIRHSDSDLEIKTHVSNPGNLHAKREKLSRASLPCSALINGETDETNSGDGVLCCDRSHYRTDLCYMRGDIRTEPASNPANIFLYGAQQDAVTEKIKPYTRKFEEGIMNSIEEVTINPNILLANQTAADTCDVVHDVPAIVFSTGGYTGNLYHEFSDGLIPLYITSKRFEKEVVFVVLEYHRWWGVKYQGILEQMTNYPVVDFREDRRVHCFKEMIVGMKIHGELIIDPQLMPGGYSIKDFHSLLHRGLTSEADSRFDEIEPMQKITKAEPLLPSSHCLNTSMTNITTNSTRNLKIVLFIRKKTRVLQNVKDVVKTCHRFGFSVQILNAKMGTPLETIYEALASADVMVAVHGAAMTHFLMMRPSSLLIQIVPLGLDWAAENFYGEPARRLGLEYMEYKVKTEESSLSKDYEPDDPVLVDPSVVTKKGWWEMKKVYMDNQNVKVDVRRFGRLLQEAHAHVMQSRCNRRLTGDAAKA
ncbi:hypothetical protein LUZ61_017194 [Rhynchospora tenuis]|uniref:Glycosyltransferase 61 catalytic domain-containing protein n=1 Tax=Rhynchospora tenuis TaxID=198213 RepID=A0AAD5Z6Z2_9POAL|nr:hypothetical protein LUZ61_017194 [Rhynchospora tenuis]